MELTEGRLEGRAGTACLQLTFEGDKGVFPHQACPGCLKTCPSAAAIQRRETGLALTLSTSKKPGSLGGMQTMGLAHYRGMRHGGWGSIITVFLKNPKKISCTVLGTTHKPTYQEQNFNELQQPILSGLL